jgi:hypothetical protein
MLVARTSRPAGALAALRVLEPDMLRVLDADDPRHPGPPQQFGVWRGEAGDAAGAFAELEMLLPDMPRVLGPDHPDTLKTRSNIAFWRTKLGI